MIHKFKLPLISASHRQVFDAGRNVAFQIYSGGMGVEAADEFEEFAIKACNVHDQLVAALRDTVDSLEFTAKAFPTVMGYGVRQERIHAAKAALTAAGAA